MIIVEATSKVSEEKKGEIRNFAENLLINGCSKSAVGLKVAKRFGCGVSTTYRKEDTILNLHPCTSL